MRIVIETIPHAAQRYPTVGDWWIDHDGVWHIRVSEEVEKPGASNAFLVALHELVEMALCIREGIDEQDVTAFDTQFLEHDGDGEPGDSTAAPYYFQHQVASGIERIMAAELGVDWTEYDEAVNAL